MACLPQRLDAAVVPCRASISATGRLILRSGSCWHNRSAARYLPARKVSRTVATLSGEIVRRSICHVGVVGYHAHVTASAAVYHALASLPPLVWFAGMLTLAGTVYEISKGAYQLLLYWGAKSQWADASEQEPLVLYGVDLSRSSFFNRESVKKAVEFAAQAHHCQKRRTGEPYVVHCIETALIVESNLGQLEDDSRAEAAVVAALLHDVLDDTSVELAEIQAEFGEKVADMVKKVSQLNNANQLLRRRKRQGLLRRSPEEQAALWGELKNMILAMVVAEPLVVLIKLADRLHNMRTVYVLKPDKQRSVGEETQEVWCSMAERLGWDALKSEMEDLCFATLQPDAYTELRSKLHKLWGLEEEEGEEEVTEAVVQLPSLPLPVLPPVILGQSASAIPKAAIAAVNALQTAVALDAGSASLSASAGPISNIFSLGKSIRPRSVPPWDPKLFASGKRAAGPPVGRKEERERSSAQERGWAAYTVCSVDDDEDASEREEWLGGKSDGGSSVQDGRREMYSVDSMDVDDGVLERQAGRDGQRETAGQVLADELERETRVWRAAAEAMQERRLSHVLASTSQPGSTLLASSPLDRELPTLAPKPELPSISRLSNPEVSAASTPSPSVTLPTAKSPITQSSHSFPSSSTPAVSVTADSSAISQSYVATYSTASAPTAYQMAEPSAPPAELLMSAAAHPSLSSPLSVTGESHHTRAMQAEECSSSNVAVLTQTPVCTIGTDEVLTPAQLLALEQAYANPASPSHTSSYSTCEEPPHGAVGHPAAIEQLASRGLPAATAADSTAPVASVNTLPTRYSSTPTHQLVADSSSVAVKKLPSSMPPAPAASNYLYITSSHEVVLQELPLPAAAASSSMSTAADGETLQAVGRVAENGGEGLSLATPLVTPTPTPPPLTPQQRRLKSLLSTVVAFDSSRFGHQAHVPNVGGMRALDAAANELSYRIRAGSYSAGLAITVQGRLKSMRSVSHKMRQKDLTVEQVYDARGLRVIVDDEQGTREHEAMYVCYRVEQTVRGMYKLIPGQYDDYIANPKPSGYRALHMAVRGPDNQPMEVQVKTSSMHQHAEFGGAAHWAYKEQVPLPKLVTNPSQGSKGPYEGQPLIQVDFSGYNGKFRYGVVVGVDKDPAYSQLLVAIRCGGTVPEYPFWAPISFYRELHAYATKHFLSKGLRNPGNGDLKVVLENYVACNDGRYHRIDQFGQVQRYCTVALKRITALDLGERQSGLGFVPPNWRQLLQKEAEEADPDRARLFRQRQRAFVKTQIARRRLQQGQGPDSPPPPVEDEQEQLELLQSEEVAVLIWPDGKIVHFPRGTTAGAVVKQRGILEIENTMSSLGTHSNLVNVNNQLVPESTPLEDGDLLILSREKLQI